MPSNFRKNYKQMILVHKLKLLFIGIPYSASTAISKDLHKIMVKGHTEKTFSLSSLMKLLRWRKIIMCLQ